MFHIKSFTHMCNASCDKDLPYTICSSVYTITSLEEQYEHFVSNNSCLWLYWSKLCGLTCKLGIVKKKQVYIVRNFTRSVIISGDCNLCRSTVPLFFCFVYLFACLFLCLVNDIINSPLVLGIVFFSLLLCSINLFSVL